MRLRGFYGKDLDGFEADLAILFGAGLADPDHATLDGIQFVVPGNDLDDLPALQPETAPEAEATLRAVNNQAGNTLGFRAEVDDHAGSLSRGSAF